MKKILLVTGTIFILIFSLISYTVVAVTSRLQIITFDEVDEGTNFRVTVNILVGDEQQPPSSANITVEFNNIEYLTDTRGDVTLPAPEVTEDTEYTISARKTGCQEDQVTIIVRNLQTPSEQQTLLVIASETIDEGTSFEIIVKSNSAPYVSDVHVSFDGNDYLTDAIGQVDIIAPEVTEDTPFTIQATKTGYVSGTLTVTVLNVEAIPEPPAEGTLTGTVYDNTHEVLYDTQVCILLSENNNIEQSLCDITNSDGIYTLTIPVGTYTITAIKDGYYTSTIPNILIQADQIRTLDFTLQSLASQQDSASDQNQDLIQITIQERIETGTVGATLTIDNIENQPSTISIQQYPQRSFNITVLNSTNKNNILTFSISDENHEEGTFVVIFIGETSYSNDELSVSYDGDLIDILPVEKFLNQDISNQPGYVVLTAAQGTYLIVLVPSFSTHTISIHSLVDIVKTIGTTTGFLIYLAIAVVTAVLFISIGEIRKRL